MRDNARFTAWIALLFSMTAAALLLLGTVSHGRPPIRFAYVAINDVSAPPLLQRYTVSTASHADMLHAPAIANLPNGELLAVWYQGSREGARDVSLYTARFSGERWQAPVQVTDARATGAELGRYIKTVGNAIFVTRPLGELWLVYVSVSFGGWSGSHLNLKRSKDGGHTWSDAERLVTSPFFNFSTLVKAPPLELVDGSPVIPAYHEMIADLPELLVLNEAGEVTDKIRI